MSASLKGIRILELAQIMAGPTCGLLLADLGAEVIKIEKTPFGDDTRNFLPPDINGESAAFMMMNRNKKGIALNLKDKDGIEIFKDQLLLEKVMDCHLTCYNIKCFSIFCCKRFVVLFQVDYFRA